MEQEVIVLPITKILNKPFQAELKYDITEIELKAMTGSEMIAYNRDIVAKFKAGERYNIFDDLDLADKLMIKFVRFTYNDKVDANLFNSINDIKRFQDSHFSEYTEISKLYLNYLVQKLTLLNSDIERMVTQKQVELVELSMRMFSKEDREAFKQKLLEEAIENKKKERMN